MSASHGNLTTTGLAGEAITRGHGLVKTGGAVYHAEAGDSIIGVALEDAASGASVPIAGVGYVSAKAGALIVQGVNVTTDANGKFVTATDNTVDASSSASAEPLAGSNVAGIAMDGASGDGVYFELLLVHSGANVPASS